MTAPDGSLSGAVKRLARRPAVAVSLGLAALGGAALTRLPLFEVPGYELASAMGLLLAVAGAIAGVASVRLERAGLPAVPVSPGRALLAAALPCLAVLLVPFVAAAVGALVGTRCSPWVGAPFFLVLPIPSGLLACALGVLLALWIPKAWKAGLAYAAIVLATLAWSLWPLWSGPQVFALNHLLGYFPGPLYDESLPVDSRLLWYRALTLGWAAVLALAARAFASPETGRLGRRFRGGPGLVAGLAAALLAIAGGWLFEFELGLRTRPSDLEKELGGRAETEHFVLHFPRGKGAQDVEQLKRDAEFDYDRVSAFLGAAPAGKVHAWFHEGAERKRELVGAANTNFAKPWRLELHVHDEALPHRVLRHELAHCVAAAAGAPPFGVSARWLVGINVGLVEGIAVASDAGADDELSVHQWAAAMRRLKLAPDVRSIVGPTGFYREAPARAYTYTGSFLRWIHDTLGADKLRRLYRDGDFEAATGRSLDALAGEWEKFLDQVPLEEAALHVAQIRFERGSVFDRPCAREMALLKGEADLLRRADPDRSIALYQRCAAIEPGNPAWLRAQAEVAAARKDWAGARAGWEGILALQQQTPAVKAKALMGLGDAMWWQGSPAQAKAAFAKALSLHRDRGTDRVATVKIGAIDDPLAGPVVRRYFDEPELPAILGLQELALAQPANAVARYLVGRQLLQHGAPADAVRWLDQAVATGLGDAELDREARRQLVEALYRAGDCARLPAAAAPLAASTDGSDQAFARDWQERCAFEIRVFGGPIVPPR